MSVEFKAVPAGRAVEIVRAWALHTWPMRVEEGMGVYTGLGFRSAGSDPEASTSDLPPTRAPPTSIVSMIQCSECGRSCRTRP